MTALLLIAVAGFSDGLDGYLAKRFDWRSRLGGLLDPLADKLLLVSTFVTLTWLGLVPVWLDCRRHPARFRHRQRWPRLPGRRRAVQPEPSRATSSTLALSCCILCAVIANHGFGVPPSHWFSRPEQRSSSHRWWSGLDYVVRWSGKAARADASSMQQLPLEIRLADHAVFRNFLPAGNELVIHELRQTAAPAAAPILWMWGPAESGRTHLLQACIADADERGQRSSYVPLDRSLALPAAALDGLGELDVVGLDDIDAIAGDAGFEQVFGLFETLRHRGRMVVSASRRLRRAVSAAGSCLTVEIRRRLSCAAAR